MPRGSVGAVWHPGGFAALRFRPAGAAFHAGLAHLPRPAFLDQRDDPWSIGDRVVWGEATTESPAALAPLIQPLRDHWLSLAGLPSQVIHGDLGGNVLFAEGLPPAVIDFPPYYRPVGFAAAIVVVDALAWAGADRSILELVRPIEHIDQLLVRAALYRIITTGAASPGDPARLAAEVRANREVVALIAEQCRRSAAGQR